jgi:hypothetical protein
MKVVNQIIPFSNAGVQGLKVVGSTIKKNPKMALLAAAPFMAATVLSRANNRRFETSALINDREYTNNWVIQYGEYTKVDGTKGPLFIKIPKGPLAAPICFLGEALYNLTKKDRAPQSVFDIIMSTGSEALKTTLPVDVTPSNLAVNIQPPLISTGISIWGNKDPYTNTPIVPMGEETLPPEQQFDARTSTLAVALGQISRVSPRKIDFAINDYLAGTGQTASWLLSLGLEASGYKPKAYGSALVNQPTSIEQLSQVPGVGRFLGTKGNRLTNMGWNTFDDVQLSTNREFANLPLVSQLGIKLGVAGNNFGDLVLTPVERTQHQRIISKIVMDKMREAIPNLISTTPQGKKTELDKVMGDAKDAAREEFLLTSTITEPQKFDSAVMKSQRADLSKIKQMLIDTNVIVNKKASSVIKKMLRYADPDLDVAMNLNGFANSPLTDKASASLIQRKAGATTSLGTSYTTESLLHARQLVEPYYDVENYVWSQPTFTTVKRIADQIDKLEVGTIEDKAKATAMLKQNPLVVKAWDTIANYKKSLRNKSRELDYYIKVFGG